MKIESISLKIEIPWLSHTISSHNEKKKGGESYIIRQKKIFNCTFLICTDSLFYR